MVCIYCSAFTKVVNSRHQRQDNRTWRRRQCVQCGALFTTQESADLSGALMVQKMGSKTTLEPFTKEKLFVSIYESCKHRTHALTDGAALTQTTINRLMAHAQDGSVTRQNIIESVLSVLTPYDQVAAAVYKAYHS